MEASLLPSERIAELAKKVELVVVRRADPACEPLRKEFDARAAAWVIVLDPRGELLDSGAADGTGALKNKDSALAFPGVFADKLEAGLRRKESLQDLERRWAKEPKEEAGFEALASRLEELTSDARLRELCTKVADLPGLPAARRSGALLRGFIARSREYGALGTAEAQANFVQDGERLIVENAAHPRAPQAVQALFQGGYAGRFDVPGRCAAGLARLEAQAQGLADPAPLRERIKELSALREKEIETLQARRVAAKGNEASEAWYAAALGDAETTIRVFSKPPHDKSAYYQGLVQEAREKLQRPGEKPAKGEK